MSFSVLQFMVYVGFVLGTPAEHGKSHSVAKRDSCTASSSLDATQKQILLNAHNQARHNAQPAPFEALVDLTWDDGLASRAQELADSCRFAHDVLYDCTGLRMGQNLGWYGSRQSTIDDDIAQHVYRWESEKADYDLENDQCYAVCGHYTQLVWADTTKVGCGYKNCKQLFDIDGSLQTDMKDGSAWLLVCNYSPAGNYVGEKPYETEYIELMDKNDECTIWIFQYCNDPVYGKWANNECALTCSNI